MNIVFKPGHLTAKVQGIVTEGFAKDSAELSAPPYDKVRLNWLAYGSIEHIIGAVTCDILWGWMYVDELWVDSDYRKQGIGLALMMEAENYAKSKQLKGIWLWTQSWQAEDFYINLGYKEFTRFADFPEGYERIGLRKLL
jgi:GNAT superfamily N-acetyltransferase